MSSRPPLKPFHPFSPDEIRAARDFAERAQAPALGVYSIVTFMVLGYLLMLAVGWPLTAVFPPTTSPALVSLVGEGMGWLSRPALDRGEWWRLVSPIFLHGSVLHLAANGLVFWAVGRVAENMYGTGRLLLVFVLSGLGSSIASAFLGAGADSLGASGAIMGVVGLLTMTGLRWGDRLPILVRDFFRMNMWFFLLLVFGIGWALSAVVDNWGHGGGAVVGLALGLALRPELDRKARTEGVWKGVAAAMGAVLGMGLLVLPLGARQLRAEGAVAQLTASASLARSGRPRQAMERLDRAMEIRPDNLAIHEERAIRAMVAEDWGVALESQRVATEAALVWDDWKRGGRKGPTPERGILQPPESYNALAWTLVMAAPDSPEAVAEAGDWIALAMERGPEPPPAAYLNTRAYVRYLAGDPDGALADIDASLTSRDKNPADDVFLKVMILLRLDRTEEARNLYRRSKRKYPDGLFAEEAGELVRRALRGGETEREGAPPKALWKDGAP